MNFFRLPAAVILFLGLGLSAAGGLELDGGFRVSIYDDNYKKGLGLEFGAIHGASTNSDFGVHLNYTRFDNKTESFTPVNEFGGYLTWYYLPQIEQIFTVRVGPHIGLSKIRTWYGDVGADGIVQFEVTPVLHLYGSLIPSFFIGENSQVLFRVGLGVQYRVGG